MIVKQRFHHLGRGVYKDIRGQGIFRDTLKSLTRKFLSGSRQLFQNYIKPKSIKTAAFALEKGKDIIRENKNEIQNIIQKQAQSLLRNKFDKKKLQQDIRDLALKNRDRISEGSKQTLDELLYGEGIKKIS